MKKSNRTIVSYMNVFYLAVAAAFLLQLNTSAQEGRTPAGSTGTEKVLYKNYIWIEGENAVTTNFAREKTYNFFCSGNYALQLSREADPSSDKGYYATYVFYVPGSKKYDFWMGCTPPGSRSGNGVGYASPVEWKIDDGNYRAASSENVYVKNFYANGGFYWTKISTGTLNAGKHTLTIRINQKRASGWDYYFYVDAIMFMPAYSDYLVPLMEFPEKAPENFDTRGKGVTFRPASEYEAIVRRTPGNRDVVFNLLQVYGWLYEYDKAINVCRDYLERNPGDIQMRLLLASNLAWSDRLDEAIREYKNIISIDNKNITARKLLAVLAGWNNRYDEAIKNYREIIQIDPNNVDAYISLATQYSWKGKMNRALEIFERAERIAPSNIEVLYALGDNYYWAGKTYNAIQQFNRIISIDEKQIKAYRKIARIYMDMGENSKAEKVLDDARRMVSIYPQLSSFSLDVKGELEKERRATIREYRESLQKDPDDVELRKNLIDTYIWNKMNDEAVREYNNLLSIKVVKAIEETDNKLLSLYLEALKLELYRPLLETMREEVADLDDKYGDLNREYREGGELPGDLSADRVGADAAAARDLEEKVNQVERVLSRFNDVLNTYSRDVQSYVTQKNALDWEFKYGRVMEMAEESLSADPGNYRYQKIMGLLNMLQSNTGSAASWYADVYSASPENAFPVYPLLVASRENYSVSENMLDKAVKDPEMARRSSAEIRQLLERYNELQKTGNAKGNTSNDDKGSMVTAIARDSEIMLRRLDEIQNEWDKKIGIGYNTIRQVHEKSFLDLENDNVPIYREIANYHLNREDQLKALEYYRYIIEVQPLNVDINYRLGNLHETLGYWKSAMDNYRVCINNQPDFEPAREAHYKLQKQYAPEVNNTFSHFTDNIATRFSDTLQGTYYFNDWFTFSAGYRYMNLDDSGGITSTGQEYYPSEGSAQVHTGFARTEFNIIPLAARIYLQGSGNMYSGTVDYGDDQFNSSLNYSTLNYGAGIILSPRKTGINLKLGYALEDENELTQALRMKFREEIQSQTIQGVLDVNFSEYSFPLSDRMFLYDSVKYRMLSDDNTRISSYNQFAFRALRFPEYNMNIDLNGILTYEDTDFLEYDSGTITNLPYWAPDSLTSYGGGIKFSQAVDNVLKGRLEYGLFFQYTYDTLQQTTMMPGFNLYQEWDRIRLNCDYTYSRSTVPATDTNPNPEPYVSHDLKVGVTGKIFKVYTPKGTGARPIVMITASPKIITADGDGKDDYTTFNLTAFDQRGISSWDIEIFNQKGEKVKTFSRTGAPPATVRWDGTGKASNLLPQDTYYYTFSITNTAGKKNTSKKHELLLSRKKRAITLSPAYEMFSPNDDGRKDSAGIELQATEKQDVERWVMTLRDSRNRRVRTIKGFEFLPYDITWDGKNDNGKVLPDGKYNMSISVTFGDGNTVSSPVASIRIITSVNASVKTAMRSIIPGDETVSLNVNANSSELESWKCSFTSVDGRLLKEIRGSGKLPEVVKWNGTDKDGKPVAWNIPVAVTLKVVDVAGNHGTSEKQEIWLDFMETSDKGVKTLYVFDQGVIHPRKSVTVSPEGKRVLDQLVDRLKGMRGVTTVEVTAHTSDDGTGQSNQVLSEKRARLLAEKISGAMGSANVKPTGAGESTPFRKGDTSRLDARYEIRIY